MKSKAGSRALWIGGGAADVLGARCTALQTYGYAVYTDLGAAARTRRLVACLATPDDLTGEVDVVCIRRASSVAPLLLLGSMSEREVLVCGADECVPESIGSAELRLRLVMGLAHRSKRRNPGLVQGNSIVLADPGGDENLLRLAAHLRREGHEVRCEDCAYQALRALRELGAQILVADLSFPDMSGQEFLRAVTRYDPYLATVVLSADPFVEGAAAVERLGADDLIVKPAGPGKLVDAVHQARSTWEQRRRLGLEVAHERTHALRVLVVESDPVDAKFVCGLLTDGALIAERTTTLEEGLSRLGENVFDLVLCDAGLPDQRGISSLIRLLEAAGDVPVVMLSGPGEEEIAQQAVECGAQDFVPKEELSCGALLTRIRFALERHRLLSRLNEFARDLHGSDASRRELLRRGVDGMIVLDPAGTILFANHAVESIWQRSADTLIGETLSIHLDSEKVSETVVHLNSGESRTIEARPAPTRWDGRDAFLVALRDVTDRNEAEGLRRRLAHSDRLAAIGQLAAGVAHEINNPAAFVMMNLEVLEGRLLHRPLAKAERTEIVQIVEDCRSGLERITSIVRDLKSFGRMDSDEWTNVDLKRVVETARSLAANQIRHRARLVIRLDATTTLRGSQSKLAQVLTNLLINAAQSITEGSADQNLIEVTSTVRDDEVLVSVRDTGQGMEQAVLERIFDPFFTTKPQAQGTGLGLSLSADLVRQHGGHIDVESRIGEGSCFTVHLPRSGVVPNSRPPGVAVRHRRWQLDDASITSDDEELASGVLPRSRILVIDDEPGILRAMRRALGTRHEIVTAQGGDEGLAILGEDRDFDVILCDVMMPRIDGVMVYSALERMAPYMLSRLVFCSGGAFTQRARDFLTSRENLVLEKPVEAIRIESVIAQVRECAAPERAVTGS